MEEAASKNRRERAMPESRERTLEQVRQIRALAVQIFAQLPDDKSDALLALLFARQLLDWKHEETVLGSPPAAAPVLQIVR
jgi:hypothetical protein